MAEPDLNVNELYRALGLPPTHKTYHRVRRGVSISNEAYHGLQQLAIDHNLNSYRGGNVSGLLEAIGLGLFSMERKESWELLEEGKL